MSYLNRPILVLPRDNPPPMTQAIRLQGLDSRAISRKPPWSWPNLGAKFVTFSKTGQGKNDTQNLEKPRQMVDIQPVKIRFSWNMAAGYHDVLAFRLEHKQAI